MKRVRFAFIALVVTFAGLVATSSTPCHARSVNDALEDTTRKVTAMCVAWFGADACFCDGAGTATDTNGDGIYDACMLR